MEDAGKVNVYICPKCKKKHVTRNRNAGVTPFMIDCENPDCDEMARSCFYKVPQSLPPAYEWYSPNTEERKGMSVQTLDHVEIGGLLLRKR